MPATIFFAWYFGFIVLAGYAPGFMGESVYEGLTVGYVLALSQFIMTWVLAGWYVRRSGASSIRCRARPPRPPSRPGEPRQEVSGPDPAIPPPAQGR